MKFDINTLASQILQYADFIGTNISRKPDGSVIYFIDNYVIDDHKVSMHYKKYLVSRY